MATAQPAASRVLFRVFLSDGRVLSSYGEWARLDDRVIFSMPTQLSRDPVELHLITIPSQRVDWPRTEMYAESVRAAAYAAYRGDADFAVFTSEVAKTLNEVAKISDPRERLATAERARQKLADWPAAHYGYRIGEVREALNVLDEVIAQLRVGVGITRFDLSLSAPLPAPPPPPLRAAEATVQRGAQLFAQTCAVCHGARAIGGVKDLRHMTADTHGQFNRIVLEGLYLDKGMASFADLISREEADAIHAYLIARANEDWGRSE